MTVYGARVAGAEAQTATATIANGQSLSAAINMYDIGALSAIHMPAAWTAADLTFQASADGVTYNNLYNDSGGEYTVTAAAARAIVVNLADFLGIKFLKIRSGTSAVPVAQGADRSLSLVCLP